MTSQTQYKHTQIGVITVAMLVVIIVATTTVFLLESKNIKEDEIFISRAIIFSVEGLLFFILVLFYGFTIEIGKHKIKFWFGIGAIGKSYPLTEIESTAIVKNPWYYLWGIKMIPGGWLYSIAPAGKAVEITLTNGKKVRLGNDQPDELKQALDQALAKE